MWPRGSAFSTHSPPYDVAAIRVGVGALIVFPLLLTRGLAGLPLWKGAVLSFGVGAPFCPGVLWRHVPGTGGSCRGADQRDHADLCRHCRISVAARAAVEDTGGRDRPDRDRGSAAGGRQFLGPRAGGSVVRGSAADRRGCVLCHLHDRAASLECHDPAGGDRRTHHQHRDLYSDLVPVPALRLTARRWLSALGGDRAADCLSGRGGEFYRGHADHPGHQDHPGNNHGRVPGWCAGSGGAAGSGLPE